MTAIFHHDPAPGARPERVEHDYGSWVSGPCRGEPADASQLQPGDVIVVDGQAAIVDHITPAAFHDDDSGEYVGDGLAIWWQSGSARGVLRRRGDATLWVLPAGAS